MNIKQRIWLLPIMAIAASLIATLSAFLLSSFVSRTLDSARTADSALACVSEMQTQLADLEDIFKFAVASSDKDALARAVDKAAEFRLKDSELAILEAPDFFAADLRALFDKYYSSAISAANLMLGVKSGDTSAAILAMQESQRNLRATLSKDREVLGNRFGVHLKSARSRVRTQVLVMLIVGLAAALALVIASIKLVPSVTNPIGNAVRVLAAIEQGRFDSKIAVTRNDELGTLLSGLDRMQSSLHERTTQDRAVALENGRIRTALDRVSTGAMLVDPKGVIIYVNDAIQAILRTHAGAISSRVPGFDPEKILGRGISTLVSGMPSSAAGAHRTDVRFANAVFRIDANPVVDAQQQLVGTVVQWFDRTQEVAIEEEVQATVTKALNGDLTSRVNEAGMTGFFKSLASGMNRLIENMNEVVRTIDTATSELKGGADEISGGNDTLSERTSTQASNLEQTAASMEEMTVMVKQTADNSAEANRLAMEARQQAEIGGVVVKSAIGAMTQINSSSRKIADIIGVIDEIAFQTNLLALNAAVEAARAGDQGRGFAVVAAEVRNLAGRSASAAKQIKALIQDSVGKVEEGSKLVDESGKALDIIVGAVKKVTDIVSNIAATSREQSLGIDQVSRAVVSMEESTQQNAALVEEAAASSRAIVEQVNSLNAIISRYSTSDVKVPPASKVLALAPAMTDEPIRIRNRFSARK